ncbi:E3 ubiquitin-protein ligase ATL31-like [Humulus lupulus]|uniref:E3 ubiquitin-protein ligase ATL31-like n=1 Tax=Humulus lupulus TaxID=3486 RepID=UPI002B40BC4B|nr:E3 ubiquitin-protein ligase ATL31-like [Humulus lupulus]
MKGYRNNLHRSIISSAAPCGITWAHFAVIFLSLTFLRRVDAQPGTELQNNSYGYLANFNSSMAIVIVFLVCAFFLMGFFSIYLRRCADSQTVAGNAPRASTRASRRRQGIDPVVIDTFPILFYSAVRDLKIGRGALECAVCLSEFDDSGTLRLLPKCDHVFHPECIDAWLASHVTCPVCRTLLSPESGTVSSFSVTPTTTESIDESSRESSRAELSESNHDHLVVINVNENQPPIPRAAGKLPRSHSTGHSLIQLGECTDRYTLRIPEELRRQLAIKGGNKLKRCSSYDVVFGGVESSRNGYRSGGEGSREKTGVDRQAGRFEPWIFTMTPPFISRGGPVKSPKAGSDGR